MKVSYNGLWKIWIDKNMNKKNWLRSVNYLLQQYLILNLNRRTGKNSM